ncbi:HlyD family secretion protein [Paraburkholderia sp. BCC1885]|uniref:HlyD family secretion protein n=1 Tax=Paraburkholderia sp. BCC1885 TaxID=2562669 RepID=UPI0011823D13|nr:HlyD family secretion protein [Paraburkholderia sp. BCC1885]
MKNPILRAAVALAVIVFIGLAVFHFAQPSTGSEQSTDDATLAADYTLVAPRVRGQIAQVLVEDNQSVKAGDLLAVIDDRDYQTALQGAAADLAAAQARQATLDAQLQRQQDVIRQATATVTADQASVSFAQQNAARYRRLAADGTGTIEDQQRNDATLNQQTALRERDSAALDTNRQQLTVLAAQRNEAAAAMERAQHALEQARLNLSYTKIVAPVDGVVGQRSVRVGAYVDAGTMLLAIVPLQQIYVVANYRETQLAQVRAGQPARITVDGLPGATFRGQVDSIAPATGLTFAPIAPDNATGNFTKVVQRLPVKILLDAGQPQMDRLRVGMSVIPRIDTRADPKE